MATRTSFSLLALALTAALAAAAACTSGGTCETASCAAMCVPLAVNCYATTNSGACGELIWVTSCSDDLCPQGSVAEGQCTLEDAGPSEDGGTHDGATDAALDANTDS
jgi:hypothetical protein